MALDVPFDAIIQAKQRGAQNRQQMMQGFGQTLADLGATGGDILKKRADAMKKQKQQKDLFAQLSQIPELQKFAGPMSSDPALIGQLGPELLKPKVPQKDWRPVPGQETKDHKAIYYNATDPSEEMEGTIPGVQTGYGATMGKTRLGQYTMQDLPSNQPPSTAGGAAYQVKVAARQGRALIGKAGSAQRTGLATGDLARAILRAAPTDEAMQHANFSDNLVTRFSLLKQKITADPNTVNNPQVRKEMYGIFDEMDKAAEPWIKNQLDEMKDQGFPISDKTYRRQLGLDIPDIPFIELPGGQPGQNPAQPAQAGTYSDPGKEARYQAWKKAHDQ